jgi:transcription elongation factor Elf1
MSWLEQKYIGMLGTRFRNFKRKNSDTWNFSCPMCGDSKTHRSKARGYIYFAKSSYKFHCHKCQASLYFEQFLKIQDQNLYNEFLHESLIDRGRNKEAEAFRERLNPIKFEKNNSPLQKFKKISQLKHDHIAKIYIESRLIPTIFHHEMYWVPEFKKFVNSIIPNKFNNVDFDEGRVIFPFINRTGDMFGLQGRSINEASQLRYITIMLDESQPRLYGLNHADLSKDMFVFEGPIDSMFIPNSIASCGGELFRELNQIELDKNNAIIVYDNEPRHKDTIAKMNKAIQRGYRVCFWPDTISEKDVNKMVTEHFKTKTVSTTEIMKYGDEIKNIILKSTLTGLAAELELTKWKKFIGSRT